MSTLGRLGRAMVLVSTVGLSLGLASEASARVETLRWTHPQDSTVRYFRVRWGLSSRNYRNPISVGLPVSGSQYSYDVEVPDTGRIYFVVSAVGQTGSESTFSNEISRTPAAAPPTNPPPQPPTTLGQPGRPRIIGN